MARVFLPVTTEEWQEGVVFLKFSPFLKYLQTFQVQPLTTDMSINITDKYMIKIKTYGL